MSNFQIPGWEVTDSRKDKSTSLQEVLMHLFEDPCKPGEVSFDEDDFDEADFEDDFDEDDFDEVARQSPDTWVGKIFANNLLIFASVSEGYQELIVSDDPDMTLQQFLLLYWEWDSYESLAHLIASFTLDPSDYIGEVDATYEGSVKIWQTHHYFGCNIGTPVDDYVRDDFGHHRVWGSYADAQEWVDSQDDVDAYGRITYHLKGGQSSPTEFTICKA